MVPAFAADGVTQLGTGYDEMTGDLRDGVTGDQQLHDLPLARGQVAGADGLARGVEPGPVNMPQQRGRGRRIDSGARGVQHHQVRGEHPGQCVLDARRGEHALQLPVAVVKGAGVVGHHRFLAVPGPGGELVIGELAFAQHQLDAGFVQQVNVIQAEVPVAVDEGSRRLSDLDFGAVEIEAVDQPYFTIPLFRVLRSRFGWLRWWSCWRQ